MKVPGHVDMTRDAVLLTAKALEADNEALCERLIMQMGVPFDAGAVMTERRLQALVELLLDEDQAALLELAAQEKVAARLADIVAWADSPAAKLLAGTAAANGNGGNRAHRRHDGK